MVSSGGVDLHPESFITPKESRAAAAQILLPIWLVVEQWLQRIRKQRTRPAALAVGKRSSGCNQGALDLTDLDWF